MTLLKPHHYQHLGNYLANLTLVWLAILLYRTNPYYIAFLSVTTQQALFSLAVLYTILGLPIASLAKPELNKSRLVLKVVQKTLSQFRATLLGRTPPQTPVVSSIQRHAILFITIKAFFLPVMLNFFFSNASSVVNIWPLRQAGQYYPFILSLLFTIDTAWFSFGYIFEHSKLGNTLKSVEPTFLGWVVALSSYPPFNSLVSGYVPWYADYYRLGTNPQLSIWLQVAIVICVGWYVWATLSLGTKCSNLTNRGIVSSGAYRWVRHPAYTAKLISWWLAIIPMISVTSVMSMLFWTGMYLLRAFTEERHLLLDKAYVAYCKQVKYRFIPKLI